MTRPNFITPAAIALVLAGGRGAAAQELEHRATLPADESVFFGSVADMDVWPDGSVVVLDGLSQALHLFSPDGSYRTTIGREGGGPGEIGGSEEIELGPAGSIALIDYRNLRISRWTADGELIGSIPFRNLSPEGFWPHAFLWTDYGAFLKTSRFAPSEPVTVYRLTSDLDGIETTVTRFSADTAESATCVFCPITVSRQGVVAAAGDSVYRVVLLDETGRPVTRWERFDLPATMRSDAQMERLNAAARRHRAAEGGSGATDGFSPYNPRFVGKSLAFDERGRLWTLPTAADGETGTADLFSASGDYVTTIEFDHPVSGIKLRHGFFLASSESETGEPTVEVYRVVQ